MRIESGRVLNFPSMDDAQLKTRRADLVTKANKLVTDTKAAGEMTDDVRQAVADTVAFVKALDAEIAARSADVSTITDGLQLTDGELQGGGSGSDDAAKARASIGRKNFLTRGGLRAAAASAVKQDFAGPDGRKAMSLTGSTGVAVVAPGLKPLGYARSALEAIPVIATPTPAFRFLQQTSRANAAAVVAAGAVKPQSTYGMTPVDRTLQVVAHISDAIPEYDLLDINTLGSFVQGEMEYGLTLAIETALLRGTGAAGQLHGLAGETATQTQAFGGDLLATTRRAVTKLDTSGYVGGVFIVSPSALEAIDLAVTTGSGEYVNAAAPFDRSQQRLWGVPLVVSTVLPAKTGWLVGEDAVSIYSDPAQAIRVQWDRATDDFSKNQIRCRLEGRFEIAVSRPEAVVKITTEAA